MGATFSDLAEEVADIWRGAFVSDSRAVDWMRDHKIGVMAGATPSSRTTALLDHPAIRTSTEYRVNIV